MPRITIIPISICSSLMWRGSRVKSGSTTKGRSATTTKSIHDPGMSTRGSSSASSFTCAITIPWRKAAASTRVGVSSVFGPVYRLPLASAFSAQTSAICGVRSTNIRA